MSGATIEASRFNQVTRRVHTELAPGDFFVGNRAGIGAITGRGITDLAKIAPQRSVAAFHVLDQHGNRTNGKVSGNTPTNLKKSDGVMVRNRTVPVGEQGHVFNTVPHRMHILNQAGHAIAGVHIPAG